MLLLNAPGCHDLRPLPFYLAMEQWAALRFPDKEVLFSWIVHPTVIIGRHQCLETEVDEEFCRSRSIDIVRRNSGGGCVYADERNLMISYVCPTAKPAPEVFADFVGRIAGCLRKEGLDASVSGRNDILIQDRKVSGCAYYHTRGHAIVHTTMLFEIDGDTISRAITPDKAKLSSKGVKSVASRVTSISEHNPALTIDKFRTRLNLLADEEYTLTEAEVEEINVIASAYRKPERLRPPRLSGLTMTKSDRIEGVGTISIDLLLSGDTIIQARFQGDFFTGRTPVSEIEDALRGQHLNTISLSPDIIADAIPGLTPESLIEIITKNS